MMKDTTWDCQDIASDNLTQVTHICSQQYPVTDSEAAPFDGSTNHKDEYGVESREYADSPEP